jgi:hypothetical protein
MVVPARVLGSLLVAVATVTGLFEAESGPEFAFRPGMLVGWLEAAGSYPVMSTSLVIASATLLVMPVVLLFGRY